MKQIILSHGLLTSVDEIDYDYLNQWLWYTLYAKQQKYAVRKPYSRELGKSDQVILMHKVIAERKGIQSYCIDHIDRNGLNNCRDNLRAATNSQNCMNRPAPSNNTSGYKGVSYSFERKKWLAQIALEGKPKFLGRFETAIEAAYIYDRIAFRYYGEYAYLNFPENIINNTYSY